GPAARRRRHSATKTARTASVATARRGSQRSGACFRNSRAASRLRKRNGAQAAAAGKRNAISNRRRTSRSSETRSRRRKSRPQRSMPLRLRQKIQKMPRRQRLISQFQNRAILTEASAVTFGEIVIPSGGLRCLRPAVEESLFDLR